MVCYYPHTRNDATENNASKWMQNRWTTQAQASRRQAVNLDEAFADQWSQTYG
jgi:hypothetical protein